MLQAVAQTANDQPATATPDAAAAGLLTLDGPRIAATSSLTDHQRAAVIAFRTWWDALQKGWSSNGRRYFFLAGYAGVGKTTTLPALLEAAGLDTHQVSVCAPTGKAASLLRRRGFAATTLHALIYRPVEEEYDDGTADLLFVMNPRSSIVFAQLVVVDEASMLTKRHVDDLLSFGVPVLFMGDPAQLPAVDAPSYFDDITPDHQLTEVHRTALDSPIMRLATAIRSGDDIDIPRFADGERLIYRSLRGAAMEEIAKRDVVLVGTHEYRTRVIRRICGLRGLDPTDVRLGSTVSIARNNKELGVFNGVSYHVDVSMMPDVDKLERNWRVKAARSKDNRLKARLRRLLDELDQNPDAVLGGMRRVVMSEIDGSDTYRGLIHLWRAQCDNRDSLPPDAEYDRYSSVASLLGAAEITMGQALTVHKAQGSGWANPALTLDWPDIGDPAMRRRWLYTAVTRASETLAIYDPTLSNPTVAVAAPALITTTARPVLRAVS